MIYRKFGKRFLDITVSSLLLVLLFPLFFILWCISRINLGKPVLFRQERPGRYGKVFMMYKFRSMANTRDKDGNLLPDEARITRYGNFLRKTSLDELPELLNVLSGKMSLIGPRPLLVRYLPLYTSEQARRHEVLPGITGWAQINGRNSISWEDKFCLDVWYVDHLSFLLDLKILWLTLRKVLIREGISAEGNVTMPEFKGNKKDKN